jgi:hypothetical protein
MSIHSQPDNKPENVRNCDKQTGPEPTLAPGPQFPSLEPEEPVSLQDKPSAHHDPAIDQKIDDDENQFDVCVSFPLAERERKNDHQKTVKNLHNERKVVRVCRGNAHRNKEPQK